MAAMMDLSPNDAQKLWSKGGDCNKLYVPKLRAIAFWFFYREVTGKNSTIVKKKSDIIEDNPEALDATNGDEIALHIKGDNLEVNMEVATEVGEIDEDDIEVGEDEAL